MNRAKKACKSVVCKTHSTRVRFPPAAPNIYKLATCRRKIRGIHPIYNEKIRFDESIGSLVSQGFAKGNSQPKRTEVRCSRVVRNSKVGEDVKNLYDYFCHICVFRLILPAGPYAECCHIKPLGRPAEGPDTIDNVLCLCPNCHVLLDEGAIWVNDDFTLGGKKGVLKVHPLHQIKSEYIIYHRKNCGSD